MLRRALALPLLVLLPLAGCIADDPGVETANDPGTTTSTETSSPSPGAGSAAGNATGAAQDNATAAALSAVVAWDGSLAAAVCAPMGPNSCMFPISFDGDSAEPLPRLAGPAKGDLTLTWTPSSPLTEELVLGVFAYRSCGDGCYEGTEFFQHVSGPSPLVLAVDAPLLPEGEALLLYVHQPRLTPDPVYAFARAEQPFHVEGLLQVKA